jgi:GTPase SAR1 family protein
MNIKNNGGEMFKDARGILSPSDIQHSSTTSVEVRILEANNLYIHRPDLEKKIESIVNMRQTIKKYFVVYGPKGVGKSVLIDKCVDGKKGVVKVIVSSDILRVLSNEISGERAPTYNEEQMIDALYRAKVDGRLPTLIFEIEGTEQKACIDNVRSLCKQFAVCSNCIIILSETNAVLVFGRDTAREEIILVPELTQGEALEFIRARRKGDDVNEKEMMRLFDNVGTNAADLESFLNGGMSVDEFIADGMATAKQDLVAFPFKSILKALKKHPEGVRPGYFKNEEYKGVDMSSPVKVGAAMKASQTNVVFYDMKEKVYKLNSRALEVALRSYEPIIQNSYSKVSSYFVLSLCQCVQLYLCNCLIIFFY